MTGLWFLHSENSPHGPLSVYQVLIYLSSILLETCLLFNTFREKLTTAKIRKGKVTEITVIELQFSHSALPLMALYQCIKVHLIAFYTFRDMLLTSFLLQTLRREVTPLILVTGFWFLHFAISLITLYQYINSHLFIFNNFWDMLRTSLLLQKLGREITL